MHFNVLKSIKVRDPETVDQDPTTAAGHSSRALSPTTPGMRNNKNEKDGDVVPEANLSNQWRIYAKMEANYHLSNKFALFFRISKYYKSIEKDPFDVSPSDIVFVKVFLLQYAFKIFIRVLYYFLVHFLFLFSKF